MGEGGQHTLKRCSHAPEQIVRKLAEGGKLFGQGQAIQNAARLLELSVSTWHCWKSQYGGTKADDARGSGSCPKEHCTRFWDTLPP